MSMTTTGWAGLAEGEPWRYVGDTDQPAWENGWDTLGGEVATAFRLREAGIVDIQGVLEGGAVTDVAFTLPEGYRPSTKTFVAAYGFNSLGTPEGIPAIVTILTDGSVTPVATTACETVYFAGQIFLVPPEVA